MTWKEQAVVVPAGDALSLEGAWQAAPPPERRMPGIRERAALIAAPHPMFGGSLDHPVVHELAHVFYRAGLSSLRFNWRGVGASQGELTGSLEAAEQDWSAALEHLAQTSAPPLIGAGYSFGAVTALRCALRDLRIARLVLVAPPLRMLAELELGELRVPVRVLVGEHDGFCAADALLRALEPVRDCRIHVIASADHFFVQEGLAELARQQQFLLG
jgi:alpha/beta superfamily hydrolase